jgi:hypothetical protein
MKCEKVDKTQDTQLPNLRRVDHVCLMQFSLFRKHEANYVIWPATRAFIVFECLMPRRRRDTPAITPTRLFHGSV